MAIVGASTSGTRPPWLERISPRQWEALDVVGAVVFSVAVMTHLFFLPRFAHSVPSGDPRWLLAPLFLLATVPLAFRRRWPAWALVTTSLAVTVATILGHSLAPATLVVFPLYTFTMRYPRRQSLEALISIVLVFLIVTLVAGLLGRTQRDLTGTTILAIATWFIAESIRTRRTYLRGLEEQKEERRRLEIEGARRAIVEERMAIARELHDVVAHSLSVIAIQSGVGRHVLDQQPEEARKALAAVEETSRSALEELRGVLGVLRRTDEPLGLRGPTPVLGDLDELIERIRSTGVPIELRVEGVPLLVSQGLELTIFRIVQEALTNVVKHTNAAPTVITIAYGADEIDVRVQNAASSLANPVMGARPHDTVLDSGHGIIGMVERAKSFGGTLSAERLNDGGFLVSANLRTRDAQ